MTRTLELLKTNVDACAQRIAKLSFSLEKNRTLFPLTLETARQVTPEQEESIDALILRYSQCVAMIQDQLFRGIAYLEQEDLSAKSNRDRVLLMEKLGALRSADEFGTAAVLRNKFAHDYPEAHTQRIERLNLVVQEAAYVIETFRAIEAYLCRKGFLLPVDNA